MRFLFVVDNKCRLFYRPHPKNGGRYCFQFVCQFTTSGQQGEYPIWLMGVPWGTPSHWDWIGVPSSLSGLDGGTPYWDWMGVPPPPQSGDRATERALAKRRTVCLFRSHRKTFLCLTRYFWNLGHQHQQQRSSFCIDLCIFVFTTIMKH